MSEPKYMDDAITLVELAGERHLEGGGLHVYVDDLWRVYQKGKADAEARARELVDAVPRFTMRGNENCVDYDATESADGDWVRYDDVADLMRGAADALEALGPGILTEGLPASTAEGGWAPLPLNDLRTELETLLEELEAEAGIAAQPPSERITYRDWGVEAPLRDGARQAIERIRGLLVQFATCMNCHANVRLFGDGRGAVCLHCGGGQLLLGKAPPNLAEVPFAISRCGCGYPFTSEPSKELHFRSARCTVPATVVIGDAPK
jgi:hypothetical protein